MTGWGIQTQVPRIWFRQVGIQAPGGHILMSPWTPQPMGRCMAKKHQSSALQNTALGQEPFSAQGGVLEVYTLQPLAVGNKQPSRRAQVSAVNGKAKKNQNPAAPRDPNSDVIA